MLIEAKLAKETEKLAKLHQAGLISTEEYAGGLKLLKDDAERATKAMNGVRGRRADGSGALFGLRPHELQNLPTK